MFELPMWRFPLEGDRVRLRPLQMRDLANFFSYRSDPAVGRFQGWWPMSADDARTFIGSMLDVDRPRTGNWVQLGIALPESDHLIGDVGIHLDHAGLLAHVGYSCARLFQRQGLTTEAVRLLVRQLAHYTSCISVRATTDSRNKPSERLLTKLGFEQVEILPATFRGESCVEVSYELCLDRILANS
ncbi:MAG: N-acetyltransferase [Burkholderiales bacterium]|nr:MAG: N-acetyltransferase [Burkholderiales bacterium]